MADFLGYNQPVYSPAKLPEGQRAALSAMIRQAREGKDWSLEQLARAATAASQRRGGNARGLPAQAGIWAITKLSRHHVSGLESCPASPMSDADKRARLLGVALALDLDRARVNELAGGI